MSIKENLWRAMKDLREAQEKIERLEAELLERAAPEDDPIDHWGKR